jgi:hypothetical protein
MVSKCANPDCSESFRYFHIGKLFRFETTRGWERRRALGEGEVPRKAMRRIEFYWLCENCAATMTLAYQPDVGISVHPSAHAASATA